MDPIHNKWVDQTAVGVGAVDHYISSVYRPVYSQAGQNFLKQVDAGGQFSNILLLFTSSHFLDILLCFIVSETDVQLCEAAFFGVFMEVM